MTSSNRPEPRPPTAEELDVRFGRVPKNWWELIPAFAVELVATSGTDRSGDWPDFFILYRHRLVPALYGIAPESRLQGAMDMDFTDQKVSEGYYERMGQTGRAAWEDVQPMVAAGHDVVTWGSGGETLEELRKLRDAQDEAGLREAGPRFLAQLRAEGRVGPVGDFRSLLNRFILDAMITLQEESTEVSLEEDELLWALNHHDPSIRERAMLELGKLETPFEHEESGSGDVGS